MVFEAVTSSDQWQRACVRAIARQVNPISMNEAHDGAITTRHYVCGSVSHPGTGHHVVIVEHAGDTETYCDCEGSQHGRACQHVAACLINLGKLAPR